MTETDNNVSDIQLDERSETLLRLLVARFIEQGQPVGSRTLSHEPDLMLSAATIRNVMSDLEHMGLIKAPHTSAGRIPTAMGYRLFIDSLLTVRPLRAAKEQEIKYRLNEETDAKELMMAASNLLSEVTQFAGIVFLPDSSISKFRQIEFVGLSHNRILVILVTEDGTVQNRVIHNNRGYSPSELTEAANYFNDVYRGKPLAWVKETLVAEMKRDQEQINALMQAAISIASQMFGRDDRHDEDLVLSGEANLLKVPDFAAVEKIRKIFDTFNRRNSLLNLLDLSVRARGVSIFIGSESGYDGLDDCSVVTAPYEVEGQSLGAIGVIGPTRMPYDRVIPVVDVTAKMLGNALAHLSHD